MKQTRKKHSPAFKAKVTLAALQGDQTIAQLARRFEDQPRKFTLEKGTGGLFGTEQKSLEQAKNTRIDQLYQHIGQLKVERDVLAESPGYEPKTTAGHDRPGEEAAMPRSPMHLA